MHHHSSSTHCSKNLLYFPRLSIAINESIVEEVNFEMLDTRGKCIKNIRKLQHEMKTIIVK